MSDGQVRIVSDGTVMGTAVYVDDVMVPCLSIKWSLGRDDRYAVAVLEVLANRVDLVGADGLDRAS